MSEAAGNMRAINKLIGPIARAVRGMVLRGVITLVNDAAALQRVQLQMRAIPQPDGSVGAERADDLEVMYHYGFTSVPHAGAEALMMAVNGVKAHGIIIAVDDRRYRLTGLNGGEVALYDDLGNIVLLGRTALTITAASVLNITAPAGINFDTPVAKFSGNVLPATGVSAAITTSTGQVAIFQNGILTTIS
jgi:phage baseplate assembly protein V